MGEYLKIVCDGADAPTMFPHLSPLTRLSKNHCHLLFQDLRAVPSRRRDLDSRRNSVSSDRTLLFRSQDSRSLRTLSSKR